MGSRQSQQIQRDLDRKAKFKARKARTSDEGVEIGEADAVLLAAMVVAVVQSGNAVMLSHTRNGMAVRITIFEEDEKITYYANSERGLSSLLEELKAIAES